MLPVANTYLSQDVQFAEQPSLTFCLDIERGAVSGFADGQEAMRQAIYLALSIERYKHEILPWSYGAEFEGLYGMPMSWVIPEAERRIREALLQDERIKAVDGFGFQEGKRDLLVSFTARTIYGDIQAERRVVY